VVGHLLGLRVRIPLGRGYLSREGGVLLYPDWAQCVERIMDIVRHCAES
jgi:hypothetical protein